MTEVFGLTEQDAHELIAAYDSFQPPEKIDGSDGKVLADQAVSRAYTEWCCGEGYLKRMWHTEGNDTFEKWINDETHYALERAGFHWNPSLQQFAPGEAVSRIYDEIRRRVLVAVMRRVVEYFRECESIEYPISRDKQRTYRSFFPGKSNRKNLRAPLQPYISA